MVSGTKAKIYVFIVYMYDTNQSQNTSFDWNITVSKLSLVTVTSLKSLYSIFPLQRMWACLSTAAYMSQQRAFTATQIMSNDTKKNYNAHVVTILKTFSILNWCPFLFYLSYV